ncbi:hypothetical protein BGZ99_009741 [Dissophora globulifera]|uniref:BZIP domain-containing protein n=1 Tax=Dissophora globulifera TaxID=979702 RepID=A0A9P6RV82_9FUNG|nr:hypothetical protein BGZ99_009741 [Dissophora globulifera]
MTTVGSLSGDIAPGNDVSGENMIGTSKLDMEPNPFEQSFAGTGSQKSGSSSNTNNSNNRNAEDSTSTTSVVNVETPKPMLPPIEAMSGRLAPGMDNLGWDTQSLRMGPLSPSMLEGPQNPIVFNDKATTQNSLPIGSFPSSATNSMSAIFSSVAPLVTDNGLPFVGAGPLPVPPPVVIHTTEPYPSGSYNPAAVAAVATVPLPLPPSSQHQAGSRHYGGNGNSQPSVNERYIPGQAPPPPPQQQQQQHTDNMNNGYNNLHLLSQAQAAHREMWIKRESTDSNGHPQHHPHGLGPPRSGPSTNMPGMASATQQQQRQRPPQQQQQPKNSDEQAFTRGVRRNRMTSEDHSDDSEVSRQSGNAGDDGTTGNAKKKQNTGDEKMDEEEKRKNFLERNRQAALKCRQRKKQWLANLQTKVEYLTTDNEHLQNQTTALRDEIIHLKALLLAHKDCPVAQANGVYAEAIGMQNHGGTVMMGGGHDRAGYAQGRGPVQQRGGGGGGGGALPSHSHPHPPPHMSGGGHHHGPAQSGARMSVAGSQPPPSISGAAATGRPMSMMQDITPGASPSQGQANVRY